MNEQKITHIDDFAARLRAERERLGMNQTEFAAAGGVSRRTQSGYETAATTIDLAYISRIAAIGVDTVYVLTGIQQSQELNELSAAYSAASPAVRAAAMGALLAGTAQPGSRQVFKGEVGQAVQGDIHLSGSEITFGINKQKK